MLDRSGGPVLFSLIALDIRDRLIVIHHGANYLTCELVVLDGINIGEGYFRVDSLISHWIYHLDFILVEVPDLLADGGSAISRPNGQWVVGPVVGSEKLIVAEISHQKVRGERHSPLSISE